jgi:hypothetical protein
LPSTAHSKPIFDIVLSLSVWYFYFMNVQVTPAALKEIEVLQATGFRGAGFLLGTTIGRFVLIEQLLPLDFDRKSGGRVYDSVCAGYQDRLQGVFFCRKRPFVLDWFLHDLVMAIRPGQSEIFTCDFSASEHKVKLVPFLEDKEGKWRI